MSRSGESLCGGGPAQAARGAVAAALLGMLCGRGSPAAETVVYTLKPLPAAGRLHVEMRWATSGRTRSVMGVSSHWGAVADVAGLLREVRVYGGSVRRSGARWLVRHRLGAAIECRYEVDGGRRRFGWGDTHAPITTARFFHGMGNAFLLVPRPGPGERDEYEVIVRWDLPPGWQAACSWAGSGSTVGARLKAEDLRHSVYLAGELSTVLVGQGGQRVVVALVDEFDLTAEQLAQAAAAIMARQCAFMGQEGFPPFVVTAIPVGAAVKAGDSRLSGVGLYRSLALFLAPRSRLNDAFEHLLAHELFHHWNGRTLVAAEPEKLVHWWTEGFTDYYALRILYESGQWDARRYAKWINRHIREYHRNPAREATNEQIAAEYWKQRDTVGEVPYQRGLLLGLRWHRLARERGVSGGVDRLLRALLARARRGAFQLTNEGIRQVGVQALGAWFGPEFDRFVVRAETVAVPADALRPELVGRIEPTYEYELGFDRGKSLALRRVSGLVRGSAAERAGLREGDRLVGFKIPGDAAEEATLHVRRGRITKTVRYYPRGARLEVLQFHPAGGGEWRGR